MSTLTDTLIEAVKPTEKNQHLFDSGGLFLLVTLKGHKWWRFKYRYHNKNKTLSLGVYPEVSLNQARIERDKLKALLKNNIDPSVERKKAKHQQKAAIMSNKKPSRSTTLKQHPQYPPFPNDPDALVRLPQILAVLPIGRSTFLREVDRGEFPAPINLGRSVLWRASEIRELLIRIGARS